MAIIRPVDVGEEIHEEKTPVEINRRNERRDIYDRHASEMRNLHSRHEREHDESKDEMLGDKHVGEHADMHMRQLQDIKDMLARQNQKE